MSVAIVTKYHGPTNYRGSRITASVPSRIAELDFERHLDPSGAPNPMDRPAYWRLTIPYPHELGAGEPAHRAAAEALAARLNWTGRLYGGALADGWAFVFAD